MSGERGVAEALEVVAPGAFTTVQDYPGRVGYWAVGVPPSGPMDALSFRLGNRLLGNDEGAPGLEATLRGPTLRFGRETVACLTGAAMPALLDGKPVPFWTPFLAPAGATLELGALEGPGCRAYLLVRGGLEVAPYLGSRSTFTLGGFGGHEGRMLRAGDRVALGADPWGALPPAPALAPELVPCFGREWQIGVLYGPHGSPEFFTAADVETLFSTAWEVHHNSARTGVRLVGPRPGWARADGGEAGLHPSNIHDNAYAIGAIDFTGDMPVVLGPDGPSLGGFVCPAVVVQAQLWKLGQLAPRDRVRFVPLAIEAALAAERAQDEMIYTLAAPAAATARPVSAGRPGDDVLFRGRIAGDVAVAVRPAGDRNLLIEFGENVLDLDLRFHAHALQSRLEALALPGVLDLTPGIRSLQVHFDGRAIGRNALLDTLLTALVSLPETDDLEVPSRIVHLPLSWDDDAIHQTIKRYMSGVRADAPWCPSNLEFIRRINGLGSVDEVKKIIFEASYLVMGLGDVYLGAPVATPLDPRHRLVTTKYNPARTWTPPNVVGIGGAYLCVYGMEGPGGYQLFGRTLQMWNTERQTDDFTEGKPWLLRFFDQIRFFPVSHDELTEIREDFPLGQYRLRVEPTTFRLRDYHTFLKSIEPDAIACKARQQAAFEAERERWEASGETGATPARHRQAALAEAS
jgi:urea carboxylase